MVVDLQNSINSRQKLESQQQENKGVQKVVNPDLGARNTWLRVVGICQSEGGCEYLQIGGTSAAETGQDGSCHGG
jgi:hypothetical protein